MAEFPVLDKDQAEACGVGRRDECCAYLIIGGRGFECGRENRGLKQLVEGKVARREMGARRLPTEPFPDCQLKEQ